MTEICDLQVPSLREKKKLDRKHNFKSQIKLSNWDGKEERREPLKDAFLAPPTQIFLVVNNLTGVQLRYPEKKNSFPKQL